MQVSMRRLKVWAEVNDSDTRDRVDMAVNARLQEAAQTIRLNSFRQGKVVKVVKNKFGKGVRQEVVGELMNQTYFEAIAQEAWA